MAGLARISVQTADFDPGAEAEALSAGRTDAGALVTFTGLCRADDGLTGLELECFVPMAEAEITRQVAEAEGRWPLLGVRIIHRHGPLRPGERIVFVATLSSHRRAAFEAAEFLMDYLKTAAPFWKKEHAPGGPRWVAAKAEDDAAAARWTTPRE